MTDPKPDTNVPAVPDKPKPPAFDSKANLEVVGANIAVIEKVGTFLANSGLCGAKSASQGFVVALFGYEHHMPMTDVGMKYHVITQRNGATSLSIKGHQLVSNFQARGGIHRVLKSTATECIIFDKAEHLAGKPEIEDTLTLDEAKKMLGGSIPSGSAWDRNSKRQLYIRLSVNNIMRVDPAAAEGAPVDADIEDSNQEPTEDQTPPREQDNDLSRRVKIVVTAPPPEPEKKAEPPATTTGTPAAEPPATTGQPPAEAPTVTSDATPPEQPAGQKPNGKGRRQLKLGT